MDTKIMPGSIKINPYKLSLKLNYERHYTYNQEDYREAQNRSNKIAPNQSDLAV